MGGSDWLRAFLSCSVGRQLFETCAETNLVNLLIGPRAFLKYAPSPSEGTFQRTNEPVLTVSVTLPLSLSLSNKFLCPFFGL